MCAIDVDGRMVGVIGGRRYRPESLGPYLTSGTSILAITVHPDFWGHGIATTVVSRLTPILHRAGHRRVVTRVLGSNDASVRVLRKCGFEIEGTQAAAVLGRDGTWLDDRTLATGQDHRYRAMTSVRRFLHMPRIGSLSAWRPWKSTESVSR